MLDAERAGAFGTFIQEYETVRRAEGRGSDDPGYYRDLPFADRTGRFDEDWRIRATSFRALVERVLRPLEERHARPLMILDIGAGNGWLSNRLAQRGHAVAAVDLLTNADDGLGAHVHYDTAFVPVQAEFDRLPFAGGQADLVVFNASLHYATNYLVTLGEALRVLRPAGCLAIVDTPLYHHAASGAAMVREREAYFARHYGFPSNTLPSENYLTYERLEQLGAALGLAWHTTAPFYGVRWTLRPWKARIRRRREPATFLVIAGRRGDARPSRTKRLARAAGRHWLRWRYRLTQRHRYNSLVLEEAAGRPILVLPQVFNPALFRTGEFLAGLLDDRLIPPGATVLDMGTGSGLGAVAAAARAGRVVAVDINPRAARCARINALLNEVEDTVEVREGDLFAPVHGERFDVVLFNPPYYRGAPRDALDRAWRSDDVVERFAAGLGEHLTPAGYALVVLSSDGESRAFLEAFQAGGLDVSVVARRDFVNEILTVYRLSAKG
jgi:HemK-related putative methylase